jgi:hypothetical protein
VCGRGGAPPSGVGLLERHILTEHPALELPKRRVRLDPQVVGERPPERPIAGERLCVPARPVERKHVLRPETLAKRMLGRQRFELAHDVAMVPERAVGLDPPFERGDAQLFEARALLPGEGLRDLGQGGSAPQCERRIQQLSRSLRLVLRERLPGVGHRALEPGQVELEVTHLEQLPGRACVQPRFRQRLAQVRDMNLHHLPSRLRKVLAPEGVDDLLAGHGAVRP